MGEWLLVAIGIVFLYFCIYGIVHLVRLRKHGMLSPVGYSDPQSRFRFVFPSEWTLITKNPNLVFRTNDHDGKVTITLLDRSTSELGGEAHLRRKLEEQGISPDDVEFNAIETHGRTAISLESRATQDLERLYFQEWLVDLPKCRFLLSYRCSVLYGLVDGQSIDQLIRSLKVPGES